MLVWWLLAVGNLHLGELWSLFSCLGVESLDRSSEGWIAPPPFLWLRALEAEVAEGNVCACLCLYGTRRPGSVPGNCSGTWLNFRLPQAPKMGSMFRPRTLLQGRGLQQSGGAKHSGAGGVGCPAAAHSSSGSAGSLSATFCSSLKCEFCH